MQHYLILNPKKISDYIYVGREKTIKITHDLSDNRQISNLNSLFLFTKESQNCNILAALIAKLNLVSKKRSSLFFLKSTKCHYDFYPNEDDYHVQYKTMVIIIQQQHQFDQAIYQQTFLTKSKKKKKKINYFGFKQ
jgi:hypothetical protein